MATNHLPYSSDVATTLTSADHSGDQDLLQNIRRALARNKVVLMPGYSSPTERTVHMNAKDLQDKLGVLERCPIEVHGVSPIFYSICLLTPVSRYGQEKQGLE